MADIYCKVCGEPWDVSGVLAAIYGREADMSKAEAEKLLKGEGCPCCHGKPKDKKSHDDEYFEGLLNIDGEIDIMDYL